MVTKGTEKNDWIGLKSEEREEQAQKEKEKK